MSQINSWNVPYSVISFFEKALGGHDKVLGVTRTRDILFHLELLNGETMNVLLVNEYTLGLAAVLRAREEFPTANHIVTGASWNAYTMEAKEHGWSSHVGIFNLSEFLGALNWPQPIKYHRKDREGNPIYAHRIA
jgi:hypothetical protein